MSEKKFLYILYLANFLITLSKYSFFFDKRCCGPKANYFIEAIFTKQRATALQYNLSTETQITKKIRECTMLTVSNTYMFVVAEIIENNKRKQRFIKKKYITFSTMYLGLFWGIFMRTHSGASVYRTFHSVVLKNSLGSASDWFGSMRPRNSVTAFWLTILRILSDSGKPS